MFFSWKVILCCTAVYVFLAVQCNADCYGSKPSLDINDLTLIKECRDVDGKVHNDGEKWTHDCYLCECLNGNMRCCSSFMTPSAYDTELCKKLFHRETCTYEVVKKDNPSEVCVVDAYV
ncbi:beta-microseminoprotein-like [Spea bombifrons]|uniref:beta-microseminoprotein-like n=1 Tax=Spea bombifrons TaxID=233779 RepID=UPI00234AE33E|nr:beta-microseminoprotein-like [Spea bombifrons]